VAASGGNVAAYYPASGGSVSGSNTFYYNTPVAEQNPSVAYYNYEQAFAYVPAVNPSVAYYNYEQAFAYVPGSGGNVAYYNYEQTFAYVPGSGGNVAYYNYEQTFAYVPGSGGNLAYYNYEQTFAYVPGYDNPPTPGSYYGEGYYVVEYSWVYQSPQYLSPYGYYIPGFSYYGANYGSGVTYSVPGPSSGAYGYYDYFWSSSYYVSYYVVFYNNGSVYGPPSPGYTNPGYSYYYLSGNAVYNPSYPGYSY
jgi:hypothetical protein